MKTVFCLFPLFFLAELLYGQPKDILVEWKCNMEIEILSGRYNPTADIVSVRGDFNGWSTFDMGADPYDPNFYITPYPILFPQLEVGDTVTFYKFFYTPSNWETGANKIYILTQEDYNNGAAIISRAFNDLTLETVTNQETTIQFTVDCNSAVSYLNGQPFPVINTCHIAGSTLPLQWPSSWSDNEIYLMIPLYDDGINGGDPVPGDKIFNALITFPPYTPFTVDYKYSINYGDSLNNCGGNDNEAGYEVNHMIELSQFMQSAAVENVFGTMGYHNLINIVYVPVELTSFTVQLNDSVVKLNWQTATETNNSGFQIERKLVNKQDEGEWENIGFLRGFGTTTKPQYYSYNDDVNDIQAIRIIYRLKQIDYNGSYEYSDEVAVINPGIPNQYFLSQNYPNPFNPTTKISYTIPERGNVSLKVFDLLGSEVAELVNGKIEAGSYEINLNASSLPSGAYFYRLQAGNFVETKKMILIR